MLAKNPKTGKPIRILRSEASLWRSEKTIVWLKNQDSTIKWDRWDTGVIGVDACKSWEAKGVRIDYPVLTESNEETADWFASIDSSKYRMIFITRPLVFLIGEQKFRALRISNVICLEEMNQMYPFLGSRWDGSNQDSEWMVAALMRYKKMVGAESTQSDRQVSLATQGIQLTCVEETPKELWFITQYYKPEKARREREIRKCLEMNMLCGMIDRIVLLNEQDYSKEYPQKGREKIQQEIIGKRLTYAAALQWIAEKAPQNVICVFANADIYLDGQTWRDIWSVNLENMFLALLRWDLKEDGSNTIFGPRNDSQDTWAVLSDSVKSRSWDWSSVDIPFGKAGCDNAITVEMLRMKFFITNPALTLKTIHVQMSNVRTYDVLDVVDKPAYLYVDPSGIHDMEPVFDISKFETKKIQFSAFPRQLHSAQAKVLDTYCKMLERGDKYFWKSNDTNTAAAESVPIYTYNNAFQTPQGLVYGYNRLFIGKHEASKEAWSKSQLSSVSPAFHVRRSYAIPWDSEQTKTQEGYVLYYLSRAIMMRNMFGTGDFWAPQKGAVSALEIFDWKASELPVVPHSDTAQIWSDEVFQYPWLNKQDIHSEEVSALRQALRSTWHQTPSETRRWVVMIDGTRITMEMVREWEQKYSDIEWSVVFESRTSADRIVEKLNGASGFIFYGGSNAVSRWGFSWVLPQKATVIEIQNEMDPNGDAAHVSGAAGLQHYFVIVPRASDQATKEAITKRVYQTLDLLQTPQEQEASSLPIIRMPRSSLTGFFAHAGDSFREMIQLWAEKGYVRIVEDSKAVQIWLGNIGDVLLYDRPTMDWLFAAPPEEQTWKKALFGNPKPSESGGPTSSWFFWPRRPRLVEELAVTYAGKGWNERTKQLVFYGKIENRVQEKRRLAHDWSSVCDEYIMAKGENDPYKLTQSEYLERLGQARFGLCLAGYGKKCHREVECMAMGCVPVVAADVDMENYANPPEEGKHYIRASTPEEAKAKIAEISATQWTIMSMLASVWWRENASVRGSWLLTKKLTGLD